MPKARLSNDRGLAQSSGNGLQIVPKNAVPAGLHFKTIEIDVGALGYTPSNDDDFLKNAFTVPAQSIVLGVSAIATEISNTLTATFSLSAISSATQDAGDAITGEQDLLTGIAIGSGVTVNTAYGTLLDTGVNIGTNVTLALLEDGTLTGAEITSGKIALTVIYAGLESA